MDVIINGSIMKQEAGKLVRDGGIIVSHKATIYDGTIEAKKGNEIQLYEYDKNLNGIFIGRFYTYPKANPTALLYDQDFTHNGNERRIIPQGAPETPFQDPYAISIIFEKVIEDPNAPFLIEVDLTLQQDVRGRNLDVKMHSAVYLRNWETPERVVK